MTARGLLGVLASAATLMALPGSAGAKPGYFVSPARFTLSAPLPKSNGYRVSLESFGHRWVMVALVRPGGEVALYFARGKANRHGVDVSLGRFGSVHARFTGHRVESDPLFPGCRGRPSIKERGRLEGSIRFRGEGGYAELRAERARAEFVHSFREVCNTFVREGGPWLVPVDRSRPFRSQPYEVLEVEKRGMGRKARLIVIDAMDLGPPIVLASTQERIGRVIAVKGAFARGDGSTFEFTPSEGQPQTATLEPTPPFRGAGSYTVQPDGTTTWSGDLRVPFPGLGQVRLTGPGFHATACRTHVFNHTISCKHRPRSSPTSAAIVRLLGEARFR
jgi:hypothetical protein